MEQIEKDSDQLIVFPNPGNGSITIQSNSEGTYSLITESGQTIQSFNLIGINNFSINIENISNGIYFIVGFNSNKMTRQKMVVAK